MDTLKVFRGYHRMYLYVSNKWLLMDTYNILSDNVLSVMLLVDTLKNLFSGYNTKNIFIGYNTKFF